jgi:hypothetical protein
MPETVRLLDKEVKCCGAAQYAFMIMLKLQEEAVGRHSRAVGIRYTFTAKITTNASLARRRTTHIHTHEHFVQNEDICHKHTSQKEASNSDDISAGVEIKMEDQKA